MRFLLDANMRRSVADVASRAGDEAVHVADVGHGGSPDGLIAAYARAHGLALVTRDLDFADVRGHDTAQLSGIVVLRLPSDAVAADVCAAFGRLLRHREIIERLAGRRAIVGRERVRVRPALP